MLETVYRSRALIEEYDQSPFSEYARKLAKTCLSEGYQPHNLAQGFSGLVIFIRWAARERITEKNLRSKDVQKFHAYLDTRWKGQNRTRNRRYCNRLFELIQAKQGRRLLEKPTLWHRRNPAVVRCTDEFVAYMRDVKGMTPTSIVRFSTTVSQFLTEIFPRGQVRLGTLKPSHILDFIRRRGENFSERTIRCDGSALKCFARYLYGRRIIKANLADDVPRIAAWRNQNLIHTITDTDMIRLLESCDLNSPRGTRDFAILLLLMRYGLRPSEVAKLAIDDIKWREEKILVRGKGSKLAVLPLEKDVAEAIGRYIDTCRPAYRGRQIFLSSRAPIAPFCNGGGISHVVGHALQRAGLSPQIRGARLLRYSAASSIINKGGSLVEVAELLRHASMNTTARYVRLDFARLQLAALPWPGAKACSI